MIKLILTFLSLSIGTMISAPTAKAAAHLDHDATKGMVRLSLWYEGANSFEKSMFRPGAALEMAKNVSQVSENKVEISPELESALESFDS